MKCTECEFCWKDDGDSYPVCHFESRTVWDIPPCELEDIPEEFDESDYSDYE